MTASSGRGRLAFVVMLLLLAVAAFAGWRFFQGQAATPSVQVSQSDAQSGRSKAAALAGAGAEASRTGRPQTVTETFTDAELTSLANDQAAARNLPVDHVALHATGQGTIDGWAQAYAAGQPVPVTFRLLPEVADNTLRLRVQELSLGSVPLPPPVTSRVLDQVRQIVDVKRSFDGLRQLRVTTTEGQVTVTGVAQPS
ncbi:MAG: DUF2993 domain-containing protein [Candidatus Dormibacteraeota bacterium]|nr:DUF2993 domain-containing protein [Candidatus Dormibacteraeota bacterium]